MQRFSLSKSLLLFLAILIAATVTYAAAPKKKPTAPAKKPLTLAEAKKLVNEKVFDNQLPEVYLHEIVNDEVWRRMAVQVYEEGMMINDGRILLLCQEPRFVFGNKICVGDLNKDGTPELFYYFSTVHGIDFYDYIGVFSDGMIIAEIPVDKGDFMHVVSLEKVDDRNIKVMVSNENPPLMAQPEVVERRSVMLRYKGSQFVLEY